MNLAIRGVSKQFGGLQALKNVTMSLESGMLAALIGPNGAGKTTLLNIISGLERADAGEISSDGMRLSGLPPHKIAQKGIARTFQILRGFNQLSVIENVMIGQHVRTRAGILSCLCSHPASRDEDRKAYEFGAQILKSLGLDAYAHRTLSELPQGIRRLIELARAIASEPKILLLDEPSSGLNPAEVDALHEALKLIQAQGVTMLLVEHNMRLVVGIAEKVTVLNFGEKIAEGDPRAIINDQAVITAYLGSRFGTART
jgi:branched-chain amino acid transport system ATP-binding protein